MLTARAAGQDHIDQATLDRIRNLYRGTRPQRGSPTTPPAPGPAARDAVPRARNHDSTVRGRSCRALTNNLAERDVRPVKVQQRTAGGRWRTLQGLADFAVVRSYVSTAAKWGINSLDAFEQLFTTGAWLPPTTAPC